MNNVLEFDSLELSFHGRKILSSVSMQCVTGEVVGLLGRNGSGKSSLMKIVFGSMRADYKFIRINGKPLHNYLGKRLISYLPQHALIPPYVTIRNAFRLFRVDTKNALHQFPALSDFWNLKPSELSGGYLRLVEALLVLNSPAPFCILDEPFSGLMPLHVESLMEIIARTKTTKGMIITDHMHRHVTHLADGLYLINNGKTYPIKNQEQLVSLGYLSSL